LNGVEFFNTGYEAIFCGLAGASIAQLIKVITYLCTHKKINFKIFTTTGGMPSSHTAGVIPLSTSVALVEGFNSMLFAVSIGFSLVIMQDAAGLRRAAGKTAATLNRLVDEFVQKNQEVKPYAVLKELLGHTPLEVFCGMVLGIVISFVVHYFREILAFFA
jgi:acid phosphatase family membrane protein YuiD